MIIPTGANRLAPDNPFALPLNGALRQSCREMAIRARAVVLAAQAGNSTSDSLGIDTCSLLFVAASAVPPTAGEQTQTTTICQPANTIFRQLMMGCQPGRQWLLVFSMTCLVVIGLPRVRVFRERMLAIRSPAERVNGRLDPFHVSDRITSLIFRHQAAARSARGPTPR